jgi:FkbM family methyltransferase
MVGVSMLSDITLKIHKFTKGLEQPVLLQLKQKGGFPLTYEKLNTNWFRSLNIDVVLDIGANTGQFTKTIATLLPNATVYSFEPLPECFDKIQQIANTNTQIKAFNLGIGDSSGVLAFEKSAASVSSSFLKMSDTHKQAFPATSKSTTVEVKISKLDDIVKELDLGKSLFVKIDVQGYEDKVLKGGTETIQKAKIIIIEVSFVTLYEFQPLFDDIYSVLKEWGFTYIGTLDQLSDPNTGMILQGDAIFVKQSELI